MAKLTVYIPQKPNGNSLETKPYDIDTDRPFGGYERDDLICCVAPFFGIPLTLDIAIRKNGDLIFRDWNWDTRYGNPYLHTDARPDNFTATEAQIDTVNGLFSGRILFDNVLKIAVGGTVQGVCPINHEREEALVGRKIYVCYR